MQFDLVAEENVSVNKKKAWGISAGLVGERARRFIVKKNKYREWDIMGFSFWLYDTLCLGNNIHEI